MADAQESIRSKIFRDSKERIKRDAFLYLEPGDKSENNNKFSQCASCSMWTGNKAQTCTIHGPAVKIYADHSCGLYVPGPVAPAGNEVAYVTPKESGLVRRQTRCENCVSFKPAAEGGDRGECMLFSGLNDKDPGNYDLNSDVHKHGCCNAQREK